MKRFECDLETEVLAAVIEGRWPDRAGEELRAHVAQCENCAEVAAVSGAFEEARDQARVDAHLPDAGRVWRIAQLRAHQDALRVAERPITVTQAAAFACALGVLGACFGATSRWFQMALEQAGAWIRNPDLWASIADVAGAHSVLLACVAVLLLVLPAALVMVFREE